MIRLQDIITEKKETKKQDFDRVQYYKEMVTNVLPSEFSIRKSGQTITIEILE